MFLNSDSIKKRNIVKFYAIISFRAKNLLIFESQNKRQEIIYANSLSDIALFLQKILKEHYFEDESQNKR